MSPRVVAISGPDNVGKSTQLRWLSRVCGDVAIGGGIQDYDMEWPTRRLGGQEGWWFDWPTPRRSEAIFRAYKLRSDALGEARSLLDRGPRMFTAVCAATSVIRDGGKVGAAIEMVEALCGARQHYANVHEILLLPAMDAEECARQALAGEQQVRDLRYVEYQKALAEALLIQASRGEYAAVVVRAGRSISEVCRELCEKLPRPFADSPPPFADVDGVIVLGGLSESGKSTAAELLRRRWGFTRLKISYLVEQAARRCNLSLDAFYSQSPEFISEETLVELNTFARAHKFARNFSLESAHRSEVALHWKATLGSRLSIVFLDAAKRSRLERTNEGRASLEARDLEKGERGADRIRDCADVVIDNNRGIAELRRAVASLATKTGAGQVGGGEASHEEVIDTLRALCEAHAPGDLRYAAVAGSLANGSWQPGLSDIDLVMIVDEWRRDDLVVLASAIGAAFPDTKIGLNILTISEVTGALLSGNLTHKLRLGADGALCELIPAKIALPAISSAEDLRRSEADLITSVVMLRREALLADAEIRPLKKHVALTAKVLLRACAIDIEGDQAAITTASEVFGVGLPDPYDTLGWSLFGLALYANRASYASDLG